MYATSKSILPTVAEAPRLKRRGVRRALAAMATLAVVGSSLIAGATAANAEPCSVNNCGQIHVLGTSTIGALISDNIPWYNGNQASVGVGGYSNGSQDWDTFRVPSGYCATYVFGDYRAGKTINRVDRRGGGEEWVKVDGYSSTVNLELDKSCTWNRAG